MSSKLHSALKFLPSTKFIAWNGCILEGYGFGLFKLNIPDLLDLSNQDRIFTPLLDSERISPGLCRDVEALVITVWFDLILKISLLKMYLLTFIQNSECYKFFWFIWTGITYAYFWVFTLPSDTISRTIILLHAKFFALTIAIQA